jgi:uncharacterized protein (TIGR03382 family)
MRLVEVVVAARHRPEVFSRAGTAYWLSWALALVVVAAAAVTFFVPDVLSGPAVMNGSARGTALVMLLLGVPTLAIATVTAARGSIRALVVWLGVLGYLLYNGVMFVFATPFNQLFPVYAAMLSLSLWTLIAVLTTVDTGEFARRIAGTLPARAIAGYIGVIVALNALVWLAAILPALFDERPAAVLDGTGLTTHPVWVQDLTFWLPMMALAAAWLWRRRPWGLLLAGGGLVMWLLESIGVAVDQWFGHRADLASTVASGAMVWVFAVLALVTAVPLVYYFRSLADRS